MQKSKIEWTEATWNPVTGCTKISLGCKNCYAERIAKRFRWSFKPKFHPERLEQPLKWKKPRRIFVCSMGDLFHKEMDIIRIDQIFDVIRKCPQHIFQLLTKRPANALVISDYLELDWPDNLWFGVSVENTSVWNPVANRIAFLKFIPATIKFISFEPLLGRIHYHNLQRIDWVIVGGESGPGARPMNPDWARDIRDLCKAQGIPFFMKQMGGHPNKRGKLEEIPEDLRIREYPNGKPTN